MSEVVEVNEDVVRLGVVDLRVEIDKDLRIYGESIRLY